MAGQRVPYVIAVEGEAVRHDRLRFAHHPEAGGLRLTYPDPDPRDWDLGVLRARQGARTGRPNYRRMHVWRQWRCMLHQRCQNCGGSAVDPATGRIWWLLANESGDDASEGWASAPPICRPCIPAAIALCPHLRRYAALYSVGGSEPFAVLAHLFRPGLAGRAIVTEEKVMVGLDEFSRLERALALELRVRLWDAQRAPIP
ncbi:MULTISPECIES: hypothetical protein [unclassified Nonomuraea]|uniref:hypothetical protein n=1 Tax=unclassified Nonomuraea TaxID=2593643 RepID=UPI0033C49627